MSKMLKQLAVFAVVVAAAGCGESKNLDGTCTSTFVHDYNMASNGGAGYCDDFFSKHSGVSCTAKNLSSGSTTTANADDLKRVCGR